MLKSIIVIFRCELAILRLQKQIRRLAGQGNSLALVLLKEKLLVQLQKNLRSPFGFKDMKQLAIAELQKDLATVAHPTRAQRVQAYRLSATQQPDIIEA